MTAKRVPSAQEEKAALRRELHVHVIILGVFIGLFWTVEIADLVVFGGGLDEYGIKPRTVSGLLGILSAPFLHGGFSHLMANTAPFAVLGWLVLARQTWHFFALTVVAMIVSGLGTWLIGAGNSVHVGASGVIFGYFGFLLFVGWFERKFGGIVLSVIVFLMYGGLIYGVLPGQTGISWEGHLFGFAGGALAARLLARRRPKKDDD